MSKFVVINCYWRSFKDTLNIPIIIVSMSISIFILTKYQNIRPGLEGLFLLPLFFALCHIFIPILSRLEQAGIAVKLFYSITVIRYLLVPLLISLTHGEFDTLPITMPMSNCSISGYQFSVLVSVIELLVSFIAINHYVQKYSTAILKSISTDDFRFNSISSNRGLSIIGFLCLCFISVVLLSRNLSKLFSTFSFLVIKDKYIDAVIDPYGIICIVVLKSFLFLLILNYCINKYQKDKKNIWVFISIVFGFINLSIFFGYNRSLVLQTGVATIYTLYLSFPKYRKLFLGVLVPVSLLTMVSMIFIKQFGVSYSGARLSDYLDLAQFSNTIECYVSGPWSLASGYDAAINFGLTNPIETFLKDFISNSFFSYLPGLSWSLKLFPNITCSAVLHQQYTNSAQMIPLTSQCIFYVGEYLAPLLSGLFIVLFTKIMVICDLKAKYNNNASVRYISVLIAVLLSFTMCYTWITMVWSFTKGIVFLQLVILLNELRIINRKLIIIKK